MRAPASSTTSLIDLTQRLLRRHPDRSGDRFFAIVGSPSRPRLQPAMQPDRLESLVGMRAPDTWWGVAVVSEGSARSLEVNCVPPPVPSSDATVSRVRVAVAVDRAGRQASSLADAHGQLLWSNDAPVEGFVADICRRILGLPCPAEPRGTVELATAQWLDVILHLAADPVTAPVAQRWGDLVALHPAIEPDTDPQLFDEPSVLGATARQVAATWTWERLRTAAANGQIELGEVSAERAEWMDDAFLARWLLGMFRSADELLDDLRLFLDPELHARVAAVVATS